MPALASAHDPPRFPNQTAPRFLKARWANSTRTHHSLSWGTASCPRRRQRRSGPVLRTGPMLAPRRAAAFVIDVQHRKVGHEPVGGGAMPMVFAGFAEDAVTRANLLDRSTATLAPPDTLGDVDRLAVWVGMPGGAGTRCEVNTDSGKTGATARDRDRVDVDRAGKPLACPGGGRDGVLCVVPVGSPWSRLGALRSRGELVRRPFMDVARGLDRGTIKPGQRAHPFAAQRLVNRS